MVQLMRKGFRSWLKLGGLLGGILFAIWLVPTVRLIIRINEYRTLSQNLAQSITDMKTQRPADVPQAQWDRATDWTSNIIAQVFFGLDEAELPGLRRLADEVAERRKSAVDLATLQWIWDEVARCDSQPESCAIRFRDARLLAKEPITDESLPQLWSLDRVVWLDLHRTQITDASVPVLSRLMQLRVLHIDETAITPAGVEALREALPICDISFSNQLAAR